MQPRSLVECIEGFENYPFALIKALAFGEMPPVKGELFTCVNIMRCSCGQHDNLQLEEKTAYYDADHFREVQPPTSIDDIFKEPETVPIVRELEPELV